MLIWWRIWHDDDRRVHADRILEGDPATAKTKHTADCRFDWAEGLNAPAVSPLEFYSDQHKSHFVAAGKRRDTDTDRNWRRGGPTPPAPQHDNTTPPPPTNLSDDDDDLPF